MAEPAIAVVGAGIGGLATALALARQGRPVTLIERRTGFSEVGAGLQLSPNASRFLVELGLGPALRRVAGEPDRVVVRGIGSGQEIGRVALGAFMRRRFGAPYWVVHRADLQTILLDAVRSRPGIRLVMGRTVETVTEESHGANLTLATESGAREILPARALIGADGLWSKVRSALEDPKPPAFQGYVAWRATVQRDRLPAALAGNETGLWLGPQGHVVHYPVAGGQLLNIVAVEGGARPVDGWSTPGDGQKLLSRYASACPALRALLALAPGWLLWSLFDRPAGRMAGGHIALVGDAAHPVLPFLAQGAALAIEDAAAVAAVLTDQDDILRALSAYETLRLPRVRKVQAAARRNGRIYHMGPLLGFARNQVMKRLGPEGMAERYSWLYGH